MAKYIKGHELNDKKIIEGIKSALADYEDGAILECATTLEEITYAIREWDEREHD